MTGWIVAGVIVVAVAVVFRHATWMFLRAFVPLFLRKLPVAVVTLWFVATLVFFGTKAIGGEDIWSEGRIDPAVRETFRKRYGLDQPLHIQYARNLWQLAQFNTLPSTNQRGRTFRDVLRDHLPYSAALGVRALILAILLGVPIGIACAVKHNGWIDQGGKIVALIGVSVPSFVLASLCVYLLSRRWGLMSATEWTDSFHLWIPAACLAAFPFAAVLRLTRASMLEALRQDYVRTARAKGVAEWKVIGRHALRNSLSAVVTYVGPVAAGVVVGSLVVEKIFSIPGLGDMFVRSVSNRDMPLIMGSTVFYSALLVSMNLVVDALYPVLNPRLRES